MLFAKNSHRRNYVKLRAHLHVVSAMSVFGEEPDIQSNSKQRIADTQLERWYEFVL
jgi:hypothetical protein